MATVANKPNSQEVLIRLMEKTAKKDWQAYSLLYSMTSPQLYGMMLSMTNYAAVCEDLLQEIYVTVWQKAGKYNPEKASVSTWLATIARNKTLDWLRSQSSGVQKQTIEQSPEALDLASVNPGPDHFAESSIYRISLQDCLDGLSDEQRNAIQLAYFEGHTHAELAERLNTALGTVKSWVRRGLGNLKACLEPSGGKA